MTPALVEIIVVLFAFVKERKVIKVDTLLLMRKDIVIMSSSHKGEKVKHFIRIF